MVIFPHFIERDLRLLACDFFRDLLDYYKLELVHLNPNGIFHTAIFVHFCEVFLGIRPHFQLFWKFFRVKPQPLKEHILLVGGAEIQMRETMSSQYLDYELMDSNAGWKENWCYIGNHNPKLPRLTGH